MSAANTVLDFIKENYPRGKWVNLDTLEKASKIDPVLLSKALDILADGKFIEIDDTSIGRKICLR